MLEGWIEGDIARIEGAKHQKIEGEDWAGKGLGRRLGEPLPRKFLKIHTWNRAIWCIVEAKIYLFPVADQEIIRRQAVNQISIPAKSSYVLWERWNLPSEIWGEAPAIPAILLQKSPFIKDIYVIVRL